MVFASRVAAFVLALVAPLASAATATFRVAMDVDNNQATGCTVSTPDGPVAGVDQVFHTIVATNATGATVTRLERQACIAGVLSGPVTYDAGGWAVGFGNGASGAAVVETSIPANLLLARTPIRTWVLAATTGAAGTDVTPPFIVTVAPAVGGAVEPVPLSPHLLVLIAMAIVGGAAWMQRRHPGTPGMLVAILLVGLSGLALAATVVRDGAAGDWAGLAPIVIDPAGDAPPNADLLAVYVQTDATNLYLRFDADIRRDTANQAPVVSAGANQSITLPGGATLNGTATDDGLPDPPGALTVAWSKVSGPGTVTFANAASRATTASFTSAGTYALRLTASDGALSSSSDVTITVNAGGGANLAPVVSAGANQSITLPAQATLQGSATDDGLPNPPGALTIAWSKVSGPGTVGFANAAVPSTTASFTAAGAYVLRLTASDGALSASADVTLVVNAGGGANLAPVVNAGPPQSVTLPAVASLVGQVTDDGLPNPPGALAYAWTQVSGPGTATFVNPGAAVTSATFSAAGAYVLRLTASDSQLSGFADLAVTVNAGSGANAPPVVVASSPTSVALPSSIALQGTVTDDGKPGPLTLQWTRVSGPGTVTFANPASSSTSATFGATGTYVLRLTASDGQLTGFSDVIVTATQAVTNAAAPVAVDDAYTVRVGSSLTVPAASGVLANDNGASALSALKLTNPALGTLAAFNADGSFTYQAPAAFTPLGIDPAVLWRTPVSFAGYAQFADVNGDGAPDMVVTNFGTKQAFDGRSGALLWSEDPNDTRFVDIRGCGLWNATTFAIGDVDGSGRLLLVTPANCDNTITQGFSDRLYAVNLSSVVNGRVAPYWVSERFTKPHPDARRAQGDPLPANPPVAPFFAGTFAAETTLAKLVPGGRTKVLTRQLVGRGAANYFGANGTFLDAGCRAVTGIPADEGIPCRATFIVDAATGAIENVLTAPNLSSEYDVGSRMPWRNNAPVVADLDGDGQVEIISGSDVFKLVNGTWTLQWQTRYEPNIVAVADLDGDGKAEVVQWMATTGSGRDGATGVDNGIFIYRHDGTLVRRIPQVPTAFNHGFLAIADVDGDGQSDLVLAAGGLTYAYRADGRLLWVYAVPDIPTAAGPFVSVPLGMGSRTGQTLPLVQDLDLDGKPEVVLNLAARIVILDGRTGFEKWSMDHEGTDGQRSTVLADFDGDGHVDIGVIGSTRWNCSVLSGGPVPCLGNALVLKGGSHWAPGTARVRNQVHYRPDSVDDRGVILYDGTMRRDWAQHKQAGTPVDPRQRVGTTFTYAASAGGAQSAPATVAIEIVPPNRPPEFTSVPPTAFHAVPPYVANYQASAIDPDGDAIRFEIATTTHFLGIGQGVSIDPATGLMRMYTGPCGSFGGPCELDQTLVVIAAIDSQGARTEQAFLVSARFASATVPNVVGLLQAPAFAAIDAASLKPRILSEVNDAAPAGTVLAQFPLPGAADIGIGAAVDLTLSKGPRPVMVPAVVGLPLAVATTRLGAVGLTQGVTSVFSTTVPASQVIAQNPAPGTLVVPGASNPVALTVSAGPPLTGTLASVLVSPGPTLARIPGDTVPFKATAIFTDKTAADVTFAAAWTSSAPNVATVDGSGGAKALTAGAATISATIGGVSGQAALTVAPPSGDAVPPSAAITSPADGAVVTGPTSVVGTATDANFLRYVLAYAATTAGPFTPLVESTTPVTAAALGSFDPTTMENGQYVLRLTVFDRGGNRTTVDSSVIVDGARKVGAFTLTYTDLTVPLSGIPIQIVRTYDSRNKRTGDLGTGWELGIRSLRVTAAREMGTGFEVTLGGNTYSLVAKGDHSVTVLLPSGRTETFDLSLTPAVSPLLPLRTLRASYVARAGNKGTLELLDNPDLLITDPEPGPVTLVDDTTLKTFDPDRFRYRQQDGTEYVVTRSKGTESVKDPNGNQVTITAGGITHSSGTSIVFARDANGRITSITDPAGQAIAYAYSGADDLAAATDREGRTTKFSYDRNHGLLRIEDPMGRQPVRADYDADGRLVSITDANGATTQYRHDLPGRQEQVVDPLGRVTVFTYDDRGNVTAVTDALGRTRTMTYDARDNVLTRTDPLGAKTTYAYDANDNATTVTDALGRTRQMTYDARGRVLSSTDARGNRMAASYDANGNTLTVTDARGGVTSISRDGAGNPTAMQDAKGAVRRIAYDASGRRNQLVDALGSTVTFQHDVNGRMLQQQVVGGPATAVQYSAEGRITSTTQAGIARAIAYDASGRVSGATPAGGRPGIVGTDAAGRITAVGDAADTPMARLAWDPVSNLQGTTDALGNVTRYEYDAANRVTAVTLPGGAKALRAYDAADRITSRTDALGRVSRYEYDAAGQVAKVTDAKGGVTTFQYDAAGNRTAMTDAAGRTTRYDFDAANQLTRITSPDGTTTSYAYDAAGNLVSETDAAGRATSFAYDAAGRLVSVTDAAGGVTRHGYDAASGLRTSTTDANGHRTSYAYDAAGRLTGITFPSGASESYGFDAAGNAVTRTNGLGETVRTTYDDRGRPTGSVLPGGAAESVAYTADHLPQAYVDARGTTSLAYDPVTRRLLRVTEPDGRYVRYAYDALGNATLVAHGDATSELVTQYAYDELNRPVRVTDPSGGVTTNTYDAVGNLVAVARPNGIATQADYDNRDRVVAVTHRNSAGTILAREAYTLDAIGNRTRIDRQDGTRTEFQYDALDRVTRERRFDAGGALVSDDAFAYDAVGNRISAGPVSAPRTYTYNADNQLVAGDGATYTYDAAGRRTQATRGAQVTQYTWDARDRLVAVRDPSGTVTTYTYDWNGIRQRKASPAASSLYLVDRRPPYSRIVRRTTGAAVDSFVWSGGLLETTEGGVARWPLPGALGSTLALANVTGQVTDTYDYTAWGELRASSGLSAQPIRFAGEETDPESGFTYLRARYYDPKTASFASRDSNDGKPRSPLSQNRYLYANGNPVNRVDPSGHETLAEVQVASQNSLYLQGQNVLKARRGLVAGKEVIVDAARAAAGVFGIDAAMVVAQGNRARVGKWFGGGLLNAVGDLTGLDIVAEAGQAIDVVATLAMFKSSMDALGMKEVQFAISGLGLLLSKDLGDVKAAIPSAVGGSNCANGNPAFAFKDNTPQGILLCDVFFVHPLFPTPRSLESIAAASQGGIMLHEFTHLSLRTTDVQSAYGCRLADSPLRLARSLVPGAALFNADNYRCWAEDEYVGGRTWNTSGGLPSPF